MKLETVRVVRTGRPNGVIINKSDMTDKDVLFTQPNSDLDGPGEEIDVTVLVSTAKEPPKKSTRKKATRKSS